MNINVFLERKNQTIKVSLEEKATIASLLKKIGINPVEVVVAKNGEVVTEDSKIEDGDDIKVFSVISGG